MKFRQNQIKARMESKADATPGLPLKATAAPKLLEHYQVAMAADLASLKALNNIEEKAKAKLTMLDKYLPFVTDYLSNRHNYPNTVAVQVMVWLFDVGSIGKGLDLALVLIEQAQIMPERFTRRDIETFLCDTMYDWASAELKKNFSASPYLDVVAKHVEEDRWPVHPLVAGKVYVMLAKHKFANGLFAECVHLCEMAEKVNPEGAGVKTLKANAQAKVER